MKTVRLPEMLVILVQNHNPEFVPTLRRFVAGFPLWRHGFEPRSSHVGFVVEKMALGQVFSEYFGFPCQFSFHRLLHTHHLSSGAGIIGQLVADAPSGLSVTPPRETKKKTIITRKPLQKTFVEADCERRTSCLLLSAPCSCFLLRRFLSSHETDAVFVRLQGDPEKFYQALNFICRETINTFFV
jgi:hypothetical protein